MCSVIVLLYPTGTANEKFLSLTDDAEENKHLMKTTTLYSNPECKTLHH